MTMVHVGGFSQGLENPDTYLYHFKLYNPSKSSAYILFEDKEKKLQKVEVDHQSYTPLMEHAFMIETGEQSGTVMVSSSVSGYQNYLCRENNQVVFKPFDENREEDYLWEVPFTKVLKNAVNFGGSRFALAVPERPFDVLVWHSNSFVIMDLSGSNTLPNNTFYKIELIKGFKNIF